jgi:hypothetical protein
LKRLRSKIDIAQPINPAQIGQLLSQPFDELRQQTADLFQGTFTDRGPLAHFKSQERTVPFLKTLMIQNYGLAGDLAIQPLSAPRHDDVFPSAKLFNYLGQKAPQI